MNARRVILFLASSFVLPVAHGVNSTSKLSDYRYDPNRRILESNFATIWCFQCNSEYDPDCHDVKKNETGISRHYRPCRMEDHPEAEELFCRKIVQKIYDRDGLVRTVRRCGWKLHPRIDRDCYTVKAVGHEDIVCQCFEDACNGAFDGHASLWHAIRSILIVFGLKYAQF